MGLMQKAVETYDAMEYLAGEIEEGKEPLAPIGHITANASIEITINPDGIFIQARRVDQKILIPVTEYSSGRTSGIAAHPLCDQIGYITNTETEKHNVYESGLSDWVKKSDNKKIHAIYSYVKGGSAYNDLKISGLLKVNDKGHIDNDKELICWRVAGLGDEDSAVWTDKNLHNQYLEYYLDKRKDEIPKISMISGNQDIAALQHLKGVVSLNGNAKLISSNDSANFTYRGRFLDADEALSISYIDSQKAHNALKWVIANQGIIIGGRSFVCWNPQGREIPRATASLIKRKENGKRSPTEYKSDLLKAINGYKYNLPENTGVVIASFDAATSGRLALAYYNELRGSDFIDRLAYWDETCCWTDSIYGTYSPALDRLIKLAFGTQRGSEEKAEFDVDERIMRQQMQRLIACKIDSAAFPEDMMKALVINAGRLQVYNAKNQRLLLFTACAAIRKYHIDRLKEEYSMALEPDRKDRSYQFGRLLAVLEKAEKDTYDSSNEKRETNAIRMQSVFTRRPGYASKIIIEQVKTAYYPRLNVNSRNYYERLIGEIMQMIGEAGETEFNKPLSETYLLGYYLQKNALYTKNTVEKEEE